MRQLKRFIPYPPGKAFWSKAGNVFVLDEDIASVQARTMAAARRQRLLAQDRLKRFEELKSLLQMPNNKRNARLATDSTLRLPKTVKATSEMVGIFEGLPENLREKALRGHSFRVAFADLDSVGQKSLRSAAARFGWDPRQAVVEVVPGGLPTQPGVGMTIRPSSVSGIAVVCPDFINPPLLREQAGPTWEPYSQAYADRERGPKDMRKDPRLQKRIRLDAGDVHSVLWQVSERSGMPLIGEYDPCKGLYLGLPPSGAVPLWQALETIAKRFDLTWSIQEGWLWVRSPRTLSFVSGEMDLSPP